MNNTNTTMTSQNVDEAKIAMSGYTSQSKYRDKLNLL